MLGHRLIEMMIEGLAGSAIASSGPKPSPSRLSLLSSTTSIITNSPFLSFVSFHYLLDVLKFSRLPFVSILSAFNPTMVYASQPQCHSGALVGTISKWNPETGECSDPISIYSRQEVYIGRDPRKWYVNRSA